MGVLQDREVDKQLATDLPAIHQQVSAPARPSIFGDIPSLDGAAIEALGESDAAAVKGVQDSKKKGSFAKIAVLPGFMLLVFLILFFYFRSRGGYKPVEI